MKGLIHRSTGILHALGFSALALGLGACIQPTTTETLKDPAQINRSLSKVPTPSPTNTSGVNSGPIASAGADMNAQVNVPVSLLGAASDDGLPNPPGVVTVGWSRVSGPAAVQISNASAAVTSATFTVAGTYIMQFNAFDGALNALDQVQVTVVPPTAVNQAPIVNAGMDVSIQLPSQASLSGMASDDGLPSPASLSYVWAKFSGPGIVQFSNANSAATSASFSIPGVYSLGLTVNDGALSSTDYVNVTVAAAPPQNTAPQVSAGPDVSGITGASISLLGAVSDDGLPNNTLSAAWTKVSGPQGGLVVFANSAAASTSATFSVAGIYVLQLSSSDSALSSSDQVQVTITAAPPSNVAPVVNAGMDDSIQLPVQASLSGQVSDDGKPNPPAAVTLTWSKDSGPGTVTFGSKNAASSTASFSVAGTYVLRLTASDSALSSFDTLIVTVAAAPPQNKAPQVTAGPDLTGQTGASISLLGIATDDGLPNNTLTSTWTKVSGPTNGVVSFQNSASPSTSASFSVAGVYVLQLSSSDGALSASDPVQVTITTAPPANVAPVVNAGMDLSIQLPAQASLAGQVSDDGKPNPPATVSLTWSMDSGPGTVTFGNKNAASSTASFSVAGSYVLRLTANDSALSSSDTLSITVAAAPVNTAPVVSAGSNQTITLPAAATVSGTVVDDGLPNPPSSTTEAWSKVSGPGTVTFLNPASKQTTATFSVAGQYVLKLTASDSVLSGSAQVTITVNAANVAPSVNAGAAQTITLPSTASLSATVTDDGLPNPPGTTTVSWSRVTGPGIVTFSAPNSKVTTASFAVAGTYTLSLAATDGALSSSDTVIITVNSSNTAPVVNAGSTQSVTLPAQALLTGSATDDGLPNPPASLTYTWSTVSGPAAVSFGSINAAQSTATFTAVGTYVLKLTVSDSQLTGNASVTINVNNAPSPTPTPTNTGTPPTQENGEADARLRVMNREYLATLFENTFGSTNFNLASSGPHLIRGFPQSFGGACDGYTPGDCANGAQTTAGTIPPTVSTRFALQTRSCDLIAMSDNAILEGARKATGNGGLTLTTLPLPSNTNIASAFSLLYPTRTIASEAMLPLQGLVADVKAAGQGALEQWRFLFLTICLAPDWSVP